MLKEGAHNILMSKGQS